MQNKLQELTEKIYKEGISKGNEEAETIVADAKKEAANILKNAESEAKRILQALKTTAYDKQWQKDYRNYILAYWFLKDDNPAAAKDYLKKIIDPEYRRYARTSPKFEKLHSDTEFIEITK